MHWRKNWRSSNPRSTALQLLGGAARWMTVGTVWWLQGLFVLVAWLLAKLAVIAARVSLWLTVIAAILHGIRQWLRR